MITLDDRLDNFRCEKGEHHRELLSAVVLLWRLTIELRKGEDFLEESEEQTVKSGAIPSLPFRIMWASARRNSTKRSYAGVFVFCPETCG